jgi:hypothetical protein
MKGITFLLTLPPSMTSIPLFDTPSGISSLLF